MKKAIIVTLCFCSLLIGINLSIKAQSQAPNTSDSIATGSSNSEQGKLKGPVRRVRVETAQILVKNGKLVEGPRVLHGIATYDQKGVKIDSVSYPKEDSTQRGKQQYSYDDRGNIVELVLLGEDGSILSKMIYKYELDELGNWKKMTSAIAVYENGILTYEPIEVSYRTITYYYAQTVEKLAASAASKAHAVDPLTPTASDSQAPPVLTIASSNGTNPTDLKSSNGDENGPRTVDSKVANAEPNDSSTIGVKKKEDETLTQAGFAINSSPMAAAIANNEIASSREPTLKHVSEKVLREAAINLPMPEYPPDASRERPSGKVEVQVVVNEKGEVGSARAISGNSPLHHAAERAARNARFSPAKLSSDPTKVSGVISYDFTIPVSNTAPVPASTTTSDVPSTKPAAENTLVKSDESHSTGMSSVPAPASSAASQPTKPLTPTPPSFYEKGLGHLRAGRHEEAVAALKQSVKLNPNDAIAYVRLGMAHSALQQYAEAVVVLKRAIQIKREVVDAAGYFHLGHAYVGLKRPSSAIEAFRQALYLMRAEALSPAKEDRATVINFEDLHYNLGVAYHNAGRYYDAIKELKEVVKLNPKVAEAYYGLGVAYLALQDTKSAQSQAVQLKSLDPALANKLKAAIAATTYDNRFPIPNRNRVF
jgi:TonB family protein